MNRAARRAVAQTEAAVASLKVEPSINQTADQTIEIDISNQPNDDTEGEFSSIDQVINILPVNTEFEAFDVACHPSLPLVAAGLITGELHLYEMMLGKAELTPDGTIVANIDENHNLWNQAKSQMSNQLVDESDDDDDDSEFDSDEEDEVFDQSINPNSTVTVTTESTTVTITESESNLSIKSEQTTETVTESFDDHPTPDQLIKSEIDALLNESMVDSDDESGMESDVSEDANIDPLLEANAFAPPKLVFSSCPHTGAIRSLKWSADGHYLYTASSDQSIAIFLLSKVSGQYRLLLRHTMTDAHDYAINVLRLIGPNSEVLFTGDDDGHVKIHDSKTYECLASFGESGDYISDAAPGPEHKWMTVGGDGHMQVYDVRGQHSKWFAEADKIDDDLPSVCYIKKKKGRESEKQKVIVGTKTQGLCVFTIPWYGKTDEHIAFDHSADSIMEVPSDDAHNLIFISSSDGVISLMSLWPHHLLAKIGNHEFNQPIEAMSLSAVLHYQGVKRRFLVSAGHDKKVRFWDVSKIMERGWSLTPEQEGEEEDSEEEDSDDEEEGEENEEDSDADSDEEEEVAAPVMSEKAKQKRAQMIASIKQKLAAKIKQNPHLAPPPKPQPAPVEADQQADSSDSDSDSDDSNAPKKAAKRKPKSKRPATSRPEVQTKRAKTVAPPKPRSESAFFSGLGEFKPAK